MDSILISSLAEPGSSFIISFPHCRVPSLPTEASDGLLHIQWQRQLRRWARARTSWTTARPATRGSSSSSASPRILARHCPSRNVARRCVQEGGRERGRQRGVRRRGPGRRGGGRLGGGGGSIAGIGQRNRGVADEDRTADAIAAR